MGGLNSFRVGTTMEIVPRGTFYVNKIVGVSSMAGI
jgi:hypothetical protein